MAKVYEDCWDALATKVASISGIKRVYSALALPDDGVYGMPRDLPDTPAALVLEDEPEDEIIHQGNTETYRWHFQVRIYYRAQDAATAMKQHRPMKQRFIDAWHTNVQLNGTCDYSWISTLGRATDEEINGKPYLYVPIRVLCVTKRTVQYADA